MSSIRSTSESESRLIAIGDIHGHAAPLRTLLNHLRPTVSDTVVTLGDYVNRGPQSCDVIEQLIELSRRCRLVPLVGNHELMMLAARRSGEAEEAWRNQGGWETLFSYSQDGRIEDVPEAHWQFLDSCRPMYETDDFFFVHANYQWNLSLHEQPSRLTYWVGIDELPPKPHQSGRIGVVGHRPGKTVRDFGFLRCIDTGCGFGGVLTATDVRTGRCLQAGEDGVLVD